MAASVHPRSKSFYHTTAVEMIGQQRQNKHSLDPEPWLALQVLPLHRGQCNTACNSHDHRRLHDVLIEFELHHTKLFVNRAVGLAGVIDEDTWQIKKPCKPCDHSNNVKGFDPLN